MFQQIADRLLDMILKPVSPGSSRLLTTNSAVGGTKYVLSSASKQLYMMRRGPSETAKILGDCTNSANDARVKQSTKPLATSEASSRSANSNKSCGPHF